MMDNVAQTWNKRLFLPFCAWLCLLLSSTCLITCCQDFQSPGA